MSFKIKELIFKSKKADCQGKLYLPEDLQKAPVIIMAHGFGAESSFRLPAFAQRFVEKGIAVFLFDYRCFGKSQGHPRNLISPAHQIQDYKAAIEFIQTLAEIDKTKIGLWGISFSGGHVLKVAANNPCIKALVSITPFVDGFSIFRIRSLSYILTGSLACLADFFRMLLFLKPLFVPIYEMPDKFGVLNTPESKPGYEAIISPETGWVNKCPARTLIPILFYKPGKSAGKIQCPVLVVKAEADTIIESVSLDKMVKKIRKLKLAKYPIQHFDLYFGEYFEKITMECLDFFYNNL